MNEDYGLIKEIKDRIAKLPVGYISEKTINGKKQYYRQWRENGKLTSKYISAEELDYIRGQIEKRKQLEEELMKYQNLHPKTDVSEYETNVIFGDNLWDMVEHTRYMQTRDLYPQIEKYIYGNDRTRVCAVYGLRRTGKTTMLFQAIADMHWEDFLKTAYIKVQTIDEMANINRDLKKLYKYGFKYIFIDEVTLMKDFIDSAALFSDVFVAMGMKIVLSGTDSLGFWFARDNELYDRVKMVHTTFIPYREYSRLLGIDSIDKYIEYGGTLRLGTLDFEDDEALSGNASFYDDESTRRYIDTAISKNIQHSLACFEDGHYLSHLRTLYEADELTSAINRIIEDMNHSFVLSVLTRDFKSHDLGISASNLRRERDPEKRTDILDIIDRQAVTERLMKILEIRNKEQQTVSITQSHVSLIKQYLKSLDLIVDCPIEHGEADLEKEEHTLFVQPGMRYCQAQALIYSLMKDEMFRGLSDSEKEYVSERILEEVRGRMLEDIVILEASKALGKNYSVFKLQFINGEYDMVIRDNKNNICAIYEIKHSQERVAEQSRHLNNEDMLNMTTPRFGALVGRYVLYLGKDCDTVEGIAYRNAESFLKDIPNIDIVSGMEETKSEAEDQGFCQTM